MALSGKAYGNFFIKSLSKEISYLTENIKIMLVKDTYTPDEDLHVYLSSVRSHEVASGDGYTTGGITLTNKFLNYDAPTNTISLGADNVTWDDSSITARYAVIYDDFPATDNIKPLIAYVDFGRNYTSSESDFSLIWNDNVILIIQDIIDLIGAYSQKFPNVRKFLVTTPYIPNEVITISTGLGDTAGVTTVSGDTVVLPTSALLMDSDNTCKILLNGVQQIKGTEFIWDSIDSGHFSFALDVGDYFEIERIIP
jgi:hypothetical protein